MKEEELAELIDKYLGGDCSPEEAAIVERWYDSMQGSKSEFYSNDKEAIRASEQRSLDAIRRILKIEEGSQPVISLNSRMRSWNWMAAACIVLLVCIGSIFFITGNRQQNFTVVRAGTGQVRKLLLPDSTQVWLNAGSSLKYAADYNQSTRHVWLEGEGYFDVKHNPDKPFDVQTAGLKTQVLGTAFSISAYPGSLIKSVTVTRGEVQVSDNKVILGNLLPNNSLEYSLKTGEKKIIPVDADKVISWTTGNLVFIDMPMQDIALHLQQWYGVKIKFKNQQLKNIRLTASFSNSIHLKDLLAILSEVSQVQYILDEKNNTITYL
ncbi:FecR domain-containing protein [Pontibacter sp. 13R65]|uniref:FecR domain-containing protein n=1 Tax=Pontibacter sp. 13R65 TaxID=3127458 RepID=UPI00301DA3D2